MPPGVATTEEAEQSLPPASSEKAIGGAPSNALTTAVKREQRQLLDHLVTAHQVVALLEREVAAYRAANATLSQQLTDRSRVAPMAIGGREAAGTDARTNTAVPHHTDPADFVTAPPSTTSASSSSAPPTIITEFTLRTLREANEARRAEKNVLQERLDTILEAHQMLEERKQAAAEESKRRASASKEGWMEKYSIGGRFTGGNWKKRLFVLNERGMTYHESAGTKALGFIPVHDPATALVTHPTPATHPKATGTTPVRELVLIYVGSSGSTGKQQELRLLLRCDTVEDHAAWVAALAAGGGGTKPRSGSDGPSATRDRYSSVMLPAEEDDDD